MHTKSFAASVKADQTGDTGEFEAIVSVFGNVDSVGDVVFPGAFADSIDSWKASGNPIPVIWSHQWGDPESHIGEVTDVAELLPGDGRLPDDLKSFGGLWIKGRNDLGEPRATKVHRLLKGRRVTQFSFAYDILDAKENAYGGLDLLKLGITEVGPTLRGANQGTDLITAKAAAMAITKADTRALAKARDLIDGVLAAAAGSTDEPAKGQAQADDPAAKSAQPSDPRLDPFAVLTTLTLALENIE